MEPHKLWKAGQRAGHDIGHHQVARLMRDLGIEGVSRLRKKVFTTSRTPPGRRTWCTDSSRPTGLWVTDLTYVPTRSGMAYVCFIIDTFPPAHRGLAGRCEHEDRDGAGRPRSPGGRWPPPHRWSRTRTPGGSPFDAPERLEIGAHGTVADSFDNALAETTNEDRLRPRRATSWDDVDELELATRSWSAGSRAAAARALRRHPPPSTKQRSMLPTDRPRGVGSNSNEPPPNPGWFICSLAHVRKSWPGTCARFVGSRSLITKRVRNTADRSNCNGTNSAR